MFPFNDLRDINREELMERWKIDGDAGPFNGVADADGNLLSSIGNSSDRPHDSIERAEQFRRMLKSTAKSLTDDEIDQLTITFPGK